MAEINIYGDEILPTKEEKKRAKRLDMVEAINYDDVETQDTEFILYPYLPKGKIVILMGDPGTSKSSLALKWASIITNGGILPFTDEKTEHRNVVIQNIEDGIADTLKPRLTAFGANFDYVKTINEEGKDKTKTTPRKLFLNDLDRITDILKKYKPLLFIVDPIQSYLKETDLKDASKIRGVLGPIAQIANRYNCTFILVMHLNKGENMKSIYRALGSIDFMGVARSALLIGKNPQNKDEVLVEHVKHNLSPKGKSFAYKIISEDRKFKDIEFLGERDYQSFDEFQKDNDILKESPRDFAIRFLKIELENGPLNSEQLKEKAFKYGISKATLDRAKDDIGVKSVHAGEKKYNWTLYNYKTDNLIN